MTGASPPTTRDDNPCVSCTCGRRATSREPARRRLPDDLPRRARPRRPPAAVAAALVVREGTGAPPAAAPGLSTMNAGQRSRCRHAGIPSGRVFSRSHLRPGRAFRPRQLGRGRLERDGAQACRRPGQGARRQAAVVSIAPGQPVPSDLGSTATPSPRQIMPARFRFTFVAWAGSPRPALSAARNEGVSTPPQEQLNFAGSSGCSPT